ncbi:acyl-CoA dehydrogenase family protein [Roseibium sediminicola]|uniref:Acyl-CoA dehydrogenase family protein n=1 Tax=Roseibium sediminicola TaxID=2933272 RepID=A0ABT0GW02_9HYPH|nr:acyl-CoA dehydrogenase family protein [Roseibium sp. CAU 1639]MCK7613015.1 acyl-CoA dehydrogenase family protein [Roseibium sp. CAU 1639]
MKPFSAPLDDILFSLEHVAGAPVLPHWDRDLAAEIGAHFAAFAEGQLAPLNEPGDRQGGRLENGRVRMPDGFKDAYAAYAEQGWSGLTVPEAHGGQGLDATVLGITSEIFSGANHSLQMVTGLVPGAVSTLMDFGTEDQQARYLPDFASGAALATMCLSEPEAGSDLSRIRCRATPSGDKWLVNGEKIFISGGDQDMSETIHHLVLARTSDDGLKGLSLFLCPGTLNDGSRNTVSVTRIEEKMGLHASPTCQLRFDNAEAELVGEEGAGLKAMFTIMNHARVDVALQGVAHAARAADIARSYAAERVQGRGADGAPVTLDHHADVRRMLDEIDMLALGGRALAHLTLVMIEVGEAPEFAEFLKPVAKVYCTEAGMRATELGMQVLGGYGYLKEYFLEQAYRDARIAAIYEGANGIHERTLVTRLLPADAGRAFEAFLQAECGARGPSHPRLLKLMQSWQAARDQVLASADPSELAHDFMALTCGTLLPFLWARMTDAAEHHPDPARIRRLANKALAPRGFLSTT